MNDADPPNRRLAQPWWRFGHVWLIVAGPLAVIVAGGVTAMLALDAPDPVVTQGENRHGLESRNTFEAGPQAPALQARNHVATPVPAPARP
jgi:uncharacterized protein